MNPNRKQIASKLDPFAIELLKLDDQKKTLGEIKEWLAGRGMAAGKSCISSYLKKLRTLRAPQTQGRDLLGTLPANTPPQKRLEVQS